MSAPIYWPRKIGWKRERPRAREQGERWGGLTKRRKFVLVSLLISIYLFIVQNLAVEGRLVAIVLLAVISFGLSGWALIKDLKGQVWIPNLILPTLYPVAVALFYFLLPQSVLTRILVTVVFAVTMYALLLTANIFVVASIRTIQLLRAARTVGFLLTVVTAALLFQVIFTLRLPIALMTLGTALVTVPLFLQGIWAYTMSDRLGKTELVPATVASLIVVEVATVLAFWLIEAPFASILLSMMVYVLLGLFQHQIEKRLFTRTVVEYISFAILVLIVVTLSVLYRWMT